MTRRQARVIRRLAGLGQPALARIAGVPDPRTVSNLESGRGVASRHRDAICNALAKLAPTTLRKARARLRWQPRNAGADIAYGMAAKLATAIIATDAKVETLLWEVTRSKSQLSRWWWSEFAGGRPKHEEPGTVECAIIEAWAEKALAALDEMFGPEAG